MKRNFVTWIVAVVVFAMFQCGKAPPVKVGVLHSLTGTMSISERSVVDSVLLAIEEVNQRGGVLGRKIQAIQADGASNWPVFAREAERLILKENVSTIFGCWTSASRKTVVPVIEKYNNLLIYPVQYEGLEQSPNVIYLGATPNQQIIPAIKWSMDHLGKRFFLVGSDYIFPRTANAIIKDQVQALQGEIAGEEYVLLGSRDLEAVAAKIAATNPDVILNTINGDSNIAFFEELKKQGITPDRIPTMSFSIAEDELRSMGATNLAGNYASWNYFQSIASSQNRDFVSRFKSRYGSNRVTDDPMEAAYTGVHLWAQAVEDAGSTDVNQIRKSMKDQSMNAPEGIVYIDGETQHTWKVVRIGKIKENGQFEVVWTSDKPIRPVPFPIYRSRHDWEQFVKSLYDGWGRSWANPGETGR